MELRVYSNELYTHLFSILIIYIMMQIHAIKPGPKPMKPNGKPDERRRVTPENKPKFPELKPHIHKPGQ
ncbi:hypothetical protein V7S76_09780 [Aquirufa sp. ROCK2-A2]